MACLIPLLMATSQGESGIRSIGNIPFHIIHKLSAVNPQDNPLPALYHTLKVREIILTAVERHLGYREFSN
jgi:hypothetical protein